MLTTNSQNGVLHIYLTTTLNYCAAHTSTNELSTTSSPVLPSVHSLPSVVSPFCTHKRLYATSLLTMKMSLHLKDEGMWKHPWLMCMHLAPLKRAPTAQVGQTGFFFFFSLLPRYYFKQHSQVWFRTATISYTAHSALAVRCGAHRRWPFGWFLLLVYISARVG
jgi:hypothetical protein